jgi:hypothetical protein
LIVTVLSKITEPSVAFVIPPEGEAAAAALALAFEVVPVVAVPLFFGRDSTGSARKRSRRNEIIRNHDLCIFIANIQRPIAEMNQGKETTEKQYFPELG